MARALIANPSMCAGVVLNAFARRYFKASSTLPKALADVIECPQAAGSFLIRNGSSARDILPSNNRAVAAVTSTGRL
jgi:hypothetical protein